MTVPSLAPPRTGETTHVLILFDIDLTLLESGGAGISAIDAAARETFGDDCNAEGLDFGGQLDPLIMGAMLRRAGIEPTPDHIRAIADRYVEILTERLRPGEARTLPGVTALLDALEALPERDRPALGLLTGNLEPTGSLKLRSAGLDPERFVVRVWGSDSPHDPPARDHLPPVGMDRYAALHARTLEPERVVVIGDTEHDIRCARVNRCRSLAVATGRLSLDTLLQAGADHAVPDLSATEEILAWLLDPTTATPTTNSTAP